MARLLFVRAARLTLGNYIRRCVLAHLAAVSSVPCLASHSGTYTALCVASLLNLMTPSITEHTPDWLAR
mgnify:CR=1 FL=1